MRLLFVPVVALTLVAATGCGSHPPPAGQALATSACQTSGTRAASLAQQAAAANTKFATLAADEQAAAASQQQQLGALDDGSGDDNGSLVQTQSLGTSTGQRVLADCVSLGIPVVHH